MKKENKSINAEVHSDDFVFDVAFDATSWFKQASNQEILNLAMCNWGGDYVADEVAQYLSETNKDIENLLDYVTKKNLGFECHVNKNDALKWLKKNKPNLKIPTKSKK